ncbi:hypothetical protein GCM10007392_22330 [Saccharospirillum salsuginis]|uniref:Uncharacterized protein n=1 Tax=Saccharospirillum salsuginis TaxID=418750 RepID=A0A918K869_9GAMM|nr:hypothetical protein GCM10007392_22330 [Saccharospirillum salsuginis]
MSAYMVTTNCLKTFSNVENPEIYLGLLVRGTWFSSSILDQVDYVIEAFCPAGYPDVSDHLGEERVYSIHWS